MNRIPLFVAAWLALTHSAWSQQTWHVSAGSSIQPVLDASAPGDVIEVGPGTYVGHLIVQRRQLRSTSGAKVTHIIGDVRDAEWGAVVEGFSISGHVFMWVSTLRRCVVSVPTGVAVWAEDSTLVDHCVITGCDVPINVPYFATFSAQFKNSILYANSSNIWGNPYFYRCCLPAAMSGYPAVFNVESVFGDPQFFDAAHHDYHLAAGSPCIAPDIGVFPFEAAYPTFASEFCLGDGGELPCPCGNESASLDRAGCRNSIGAGATLRASGDASLTEQSVVLRGESMPDGPLLYFQGSSTTPAFAFGNGIKCTGGALIRLGIRFNVAGASTYPDASQAALGVQGFVDAPGSRLYQARYRDIMSSCTGDNFNYTNGVQIDWHP